MGILSDGGAIVRSGAIKRAPVPTSRFRCSNCFHELFEADRGFGSTALACPNHNFERMILEIPVYLEEYARRNPDLARDYLDFILDGADILNEFR